MALSTYSELQTAIAEECWREDWTAATLQDFIKRAEGKLNRFLKAIEVNGSLTGTSGSREVDSSALSIKTPKRLWITDNGDEEAVQFTAQENMAYRDDSQQPTEWTWDQVNDKIIFNTLLDQAYPIRIFYVQRFALSDASPTNWLLTNHPDAYLNACVAEGWRYMRDYQAAAGYDQMVRIALLQIRSEIADRKRGTLKVDAGLLTIGPGAIYGAGADELDL